jgi:hypothetical protein
LQRWAHLSAAVAAGLLIDSDRQPLLPTASTLFSLVHDGLTILVNVAPPAYIILAHIIHKRWMQ